MASAVAEGEEFRSAQEVHAALRRRGEQVGLTTVYRHLQLQADRGELDVLRVAEGETLYRRCATGRHHHHLVCRVCGTAREVDGPQVERWAEAVARAEGFTDVAHTVEVFGVCPDCSAAGGRAVPLGTRRARGGRRPAPAASRTPPRA